ncbi:hypothetical protein J2848_003027 [Azospirillum lipoferum]|uniref:Uncharacterized protein n=1 Tax=Azospirillum lipoferum TaxID=193 RepID=A0A5A9GQ96_AZOLI|nr:MULTISPECIES: hypothetical protein [Azospirillum]KAA0595774.1 hypothetical protein FZ942_15390 [Azospirillum lipoferum]MCP1611354.1 hypothetical protein [Azospirillum lipoferum]MDW5537158.1 hypothetical protein [Azospirillum sp. NL1]
MNDDFLKINRIIGHTWGEPSEFISTPPYSTISYQAKNFRISCQEERLQFDQVLSPGDWDISELVEAASNYVGVLRHVQYISIGVNAIFSGTTQTEGSEWIKSELLSESMVRRAGHVASAGIRLQLAIDPGSSLTIMVEPAPRGEGSSISEQESNQVQFQTNCHRTLSSGHPELIELIKSTPEDLKKTKETIEKTVGVA